MPRTENLRDVVHGTVSLNGRIKGSSSLFRSALFQWWSHCPTLIDIWAECFETANCCRNNRCHKTVPRCCQLIHYCTIVHHKWEQKITECRHNTWTIVANSAVTADANNDGKMTTTTTTTTTFEFSLASQFSGVQFWKLLDYDSIMLKQRITRAMQSNAKQTLQIISRSSSAIKII